MLDGVDQDRFDRLRYVEIKHGRKYIVEKLCFWCLF